MAGNIYDMSNTLHETKPCESKIYKFQICSEVDDYISVRYSPNPEWIKESEILAYVCSWEEILEFENRLRLFSLTLGKGFDDEFSLLKTMTLIWRGNKMETGKECGTQDDILEELRRLYKLQKSGNTDVGSLVCDATWHPEGESPAGWKSMGEQAARAYFLLQTSADRSEPLTVDHIKHVHSILMSGSMENCGEFRTSPAYADDYVFAPHDSIDERIRNAVESFEENIRSPRNLYVVNVAVELMLDFVTIHPFSNGNGRMCRLLFSYALQRMGFPFPVTLDSGYSKSYKHYITSLKQAQTRGKKGPMLQLALVSINATLINYAAFSQSTNLTA